MEPKKLDLKTLPKLNGHATTHTDPDAERVTITFELSGAALALLRACEPFVGDEQKPIDASKAAENVFKAFLRNNARL